MNIKPNFLLIILLSGMLVAAVYFKSNKAASSRPLDDNFPIATSPEVKVDPTPVAPPEKIPEKVAPRTVSTYSEAIKSAKESNCNIFLYFGAPWCGYCEQMKSTTLADSEVKERLSKNFVVLIINTDEDKATARKFGVRGIPAYMVVNSEGSVIRKTTGYKAKSAFLSWLGEK